MQLLRDQGPAAAAALDAARGRAGRAGRRRRTRSSAASTTARPPTRSRSATACSAFGCSRRSTGTPSSSASAGSRRSSATTRPGVYPLQDFATRDRYRAGRREDRPGLGRRRARGRAPRRRAGPRGRARAGASARATSATTSSTAAQADLKAAFGYRPAAASGSSTGCSAHPRTDLLRLDRRCSVGCSLACSRPGLAIGGASRPVGLAAGRSRCRSCRSSELAVGLVNHLLTLFLPPRVLPKLDFKEGIPADCATFVVMPVDARPAAAAPRSCSSGWRSTTSPTPTRSLRFALLTDFADAPQEHDARGRGLRPRRPRARSRALNAALRAATGPTAFFLFHRRRLWNPSQGCWMGWERKRGKLSEFNRLLRGATRHELCRRAAPTRRRCRDVRFVITLDADTQLPRDTAGRLVGTLAHPLNRPRFDPARRPGGRGLRRLAAAGQLPPDGGHALAVRRRCWRPRAGSTRTRRRRRDAYMDLFGVGSFTGKGIYDVDAFEAATGRDLPREPHPQPRPDRGELRPLRAGHRHRAVRRLPGPLPRLRPPRAPLGPRRLAAPPLARPRACRRPTGRAPNPLPALERWKLFDNLRRSLVPPALVRAAGPGLDGPARLALALDGVGAGRPGAAARASWSWARSSAASAAGLAGGVQVAGATACRPRSGRSLLAIAFLADQARSLCDAIARTLVAAVRHAPEAAGVGDGGVDRAAAGHGPARFRRGACGRRRRWPSAVAALVAAGCGPPALCGGGAGPGRLVRLAAGRLLGQPAAGRSPSCALTDDERRALAADGPQDLALLRDLRRRRGPLAAAGQLSRRSPTAASPTAPRRRTRACSCSRPWPRTTSATSAWAPWSDRLEKTFDTLDRLERHWGHFYNWYDTRTLKPLPPAYISTVDSGNLLGCLVALKQGLREKTRRAGAGAGGGRGALADTLDLIDEPWLGSSPIVAGLLRETPGDLAALGAAGWSGWSARPTACTRRIAADARRGARRRIGSLGRGPAGAGARAAGRARGAGPVAGDPPRSGGRRPAARGLDEPGRDGRRPRRSRSPPSRPPGDEDAGAVAAARKSSLGRRAPAIGCAS